MATMYTSSLRTYINKTRRDQPRKNSNARECLERPSQSSHQSTGRTSGHGQKLKEEKDQLREWESRPSVMRTNDSSMSSSMLCRVCVSEQSELVNMLNLYYGSTPATTFIMDILQIKVDSEGSSALVMCSSCNTTLNNFYSFYNMVRDAQHKYNQIKVKDEIKREISFIDIEPHTSFIDCKVEDEYMIDSDNMDYMDIPSTSNLCKTSSSPAASDETMSVQPLQDADTLPECRGQAMDNGTESLSEGTIQLTAIVNKPTIQLTAIENRPISLADLRSYNANIAVFAKYKVEEIYSNGEWRISQKEKDEIFKLYIDMKCSACAIELSTYNELDDHCMAEHGTKAVVYCGKQPLSSYRHVEIYVLYRHLLNRSNEGMPTTSPQVRCTVCSKTIGKYKMKEHLSTHLPEEKKEFQCTQCSARFGLLKKLNSHISSAHSKLIFPCEDCGKTYKTKRILKTHKKVVHGSSSKLYLCPDCGKQYKNEACYDSHVKQHQGIIEKVKCHICNEVFKKVYISTHLKTHDPTHQKQCPHCPFKGAVLSLHIKRIHDKIKPFACPYCPLTFMEKRPMRDHIACRHTGIPRHTCEFCNKTFMSTGNFHTHRKTKHAKQLAEMKQKEASKTDTNNIPDSLMLKKKNIVEGAEADVIIESIRSRSKNPRTIQQVK